MKNRPNPAALALVDKIRREQSEASNESVKRLNREKAKRNQPLIKTLPEPKTKFPIRPNEPRRPMKYLAGSQTEVDVWRNIFIDMAKG